MPWEMHLAKITAEDELVSKNGVRPLCLRVRVLYNTGDLAFDHYCAFTLMQKQRFPLSFVMVSLYLPML